MNTIQPEIFENNNIFVNFLINCLFKYTTLFLIISSATLPFKKSISLIAISIGSILIVINLILLVIKNYKHRSYNSIFNITFTKNSILTTINYFFIPAISLSLFLTILISGIYSDARKSFILKYISSYRELLFLPIIMLFLHFQPKIKVKVKMYSALMLSIFTIVILSCINYFYPLSFASSTQDGSIKDSYITHSHIIHNVFAALLGLFISTQLIQEKKYGKKWLLMIVCLIITIIDILFFVRGRTGQVVLIVNMFIFLWFLTTIKSKIYCSILTSIVSIIIATTNNPIKDNIIRTHSEIKLFQASGLDTSAGLRIAFWKYTLNEIYSKPITGYGAGQYWENYDLMIKNPNKLGYSAGMHHPHNEFLFIWHNAGLISVLLYIFLIVALFYQSFKTKEIDLKIMRLGIASSLLIYSILDVPIYNSAEGLFYALMIAAFFDTWLKQENN